MATRIDTRSSAPHVADSHDLIRVQGARENNLRDVSVEIPKRRLTVFTGVSGSGKSSLVFGTIAAESRRLINETYSAFVQGFMPTLSRPEVDVLDGLTTAIIVDQERLGANPRSTVGTATDANAMPRTLFSRLGQPRIGSPNAFSFNETSSLVVRADDRARRARRRLIVGIANVPRSYVVSRYSIVFTSVLVALCISYVMFTRDDSPLPRGPKEPALSTISRLKTGCWRWRASATERWVTGLSGLAPCRGFRRVSLGI